MNLPGVVAELTAAFEAYEKALVDNDVDALDGAFWDSELTVRYGVAECLYGARSIAEWRRTADPIPTGRLLGPTVVVTFGQDVGTVSTEFRSPQRPIVGRQSQTWIRRQEGWRIVAAHVSILRLEQ